MRFTFHRHPTHIITPMPKSPTEAYQAPSLREGWGGYQVSLAGCLFHLLPALYSFTNSVFVMVISGLSFITLSFFV